MTSKPPPGARRLLACFALALLLPAAARAQGSPPPAHPVYLDTSVAVIRILIDPDSLAALLDQDSLESDHEYPATFIFSNGAIRDTLADVGFRLRGNTSRYSRKKSFKISVNTFERGRKFHGLEKLNINGEHNDPSIIRAKLSWDLFAAAGISASRAAHAQLFINGTYFGLMISVEHVDENFVLERFGNNDGNLYKCLWPADLAYLGSDPNLYKLMAGNRRVYELHINDDIDDYSDLAHFISVLHLTPPDSFPVAVQKVLNVNGLLKALAVDIATGSWDDYWFLKNNYYLHHNTTTGRFEYLPYDYDNTFGIWWDGILPGADWGTRPIYPWGHPTEPRPLTTRILDVPLFRNRLSFYLNRLLVRHFSETRLFPRIDSVRAMITAAAEADSFRTLDYGWTVQDFHTSYTQALGAHVTYGLKPYITARRTSAFGQLILPNIPPIVSDLSHSPAYPAPGTAVTVTVRIEDEGVPASALLYRRVNGAWQTPVPFLDDGAHGDGGAGDELFGVILTGLPAGAVVDYYATAVDAQAQGTAEPPDAPASFMTFRVAGSAARLFVNEFMAKNDTTILDPFGELEDWIEIHNADSVAAHMLGYTLTDNYGNPGKWSFPDTTIAPGGYLLVWADEDSSQGPLHAMFKLDRDGERIGLFHADSAGFAVVDTVTFGYQQADVAFGRLPDGTPAWQTLPRATPGSANAVPPNVVAVSLPVTAGWNLVSLPGRVPDPRASAVFPGAVSGAYTYVRGSGYVARDSLATGEGYWIKFPDAETTSVSGSAILRDTLALRAGWNIIGGISTAVDTAAVIEDPPGVVQSPFYMYTGAYSPADSLLPARAYWVKAGADGRIILHGQVKGRNSQRR